MAECAKSGEFSMRALRRGIQRAGDLEIEDGAFRQDEPDRSNAVPQAKEVAATPHPGK